MENEFREDEKLYRAVYPPEHTQMFWKKNGKVSSAAFYDRNGLSVERGSDRTDDVVVESMHQSFTGRIIYVTVRNCHETEAVVRYLPSKRSIYHSEIHGSENEKLLSPSQRKYLAKEAIVLS